MTADASASTSLRAGFEELVGTTNTPLLSLKIARDGKRKEVRF
jgi:hypothetical protein